MAGGVCYLTTHTPATSSFVPDLPASATSSPSSALSSQLLCKMPTVAQLKAQLAAKGLPTDGVKAVLEARLAAAVPAAAAPAQVDVAQLASLKRQLDQLMAAQQGAGGAAGGNAGGDGPALLDLDELKQTNDLEKLK